jgi:serpin B
VAKEGTEAASVTVIDPAWKSAPSRPKKMPLVFRADHPFLFMIRDARSGLVLLMGRLTDPEN